MWIKSLKQAVRNRLLDHWVLLCPIRNARWSYAQEGEDVLLWRILDPFHDVVGTYVEVGCNHPWRCSNTAFFYRQGWRENPLVEPLSALGFHMISKLWKSALFLHASEFEKFAIR